MPKPIGPYGFHTEFIARNEQIDAWWTDTIVRDVILEPLRRDGALARATHFSGDDGEAVEIRSFDQLAKASKGWREQVISLYAGEFDAPRWRIHLRLDSSGPLIGLRVTDDEDNRIREQFAGWLGEWSRGLDKAGCDLSVGYIAPFRRPYPRPTPPRDGLGWPLGKLELYLGRRWHAAHEVGKGVFERVSNASLPAGVRRSMNDDVLRISFECNLDDDKAVERARVLGEQWLTPLVPTEIEAG